MRPSDITKEHRELLHGKGLLDPVIDGATKRPRYVSYAAGDRKTVSRWADEWNPEGHHLTQINPGSKGWATRIIDEDRGLIIIRRGLADGSGERVNGTWMGVPGLGVTAQLRPDNPIPWMPDEGKYIWPSYPDGTFRKQIDIHPLSRAAFKRGKGRVYFVLEGVINGDAVVSHGGIAIAVPGVSVWRAERLWEFGQYLRDREVCVVTDNDWRTNRDVEEQGRKCAQYLTETYGARAVHAAPPWDASDPKKGVGDFLAQGGTLDGLEVVRAPDKERLKALVLRRVPRERRKGCLHIVERCSYAPVFSTPKGADGERCQTLERRLKDLEKCRIVKHLVEAQRKNKYFREKKPKWQAKAARWEWL